MNWKTLIKEQLNQVIARIDSDSCEVDVNTAMQIMSVIAHEPLSKAEAYQELGISRIKAIKAYRYAKEKELEFQNQQIIKQEANLTLNNLKILKLTQLQQDLVKHSQFFLNQVCKYSIV